MLVAGFQRALLKPIPSIRQVEVQHYVGMIRDWVVGFERRSIHTKAGLSAHRVCVITGTGVQGGHFISCAFVSDQWGVADRGHVVPCAPSR